MFWAGSFLPAGGGAGDGGGEGRSCPAHGRIYNSIFILYPVAPAFQIVTSKNVFRHWQMSLGEENRPHLRTNGLVVSPFMVIIKILKKYFLLLFFLPLLSPPTLGLIPLL